MPFVVHVCTVVLAVFSLLAPAAGAQDSEPVFTSSFTSPGFPEGWVPANQWTPSAMKVLSQDGETFLRTANAGAAMSRKFRLPADLKTATYTVKYRLKDFQPGSKGWDIPAVNLKFLDGSGKVLNEKNWPTTIKLRNDTDWALASETLPVPSGAAEGELTVSFKGTAGTLDISEIYVYRATAVPTEVKEVAQELEQPGIAKGQLMPQTQFTGKNVPQGWTASEPGVEKAFSVSGGKLKLDKVKGKDNYYIQTTSPIDPAQTKKVRIYTQMQGRPHRIDRTENVSERPRVELAFLDASGKQTGKALVIPITGFITHNALQSAIGDVPADAEQMRARVYYVGKDGWLELRNLNVVPATGEEPKWMHAPAPIPAGALFPHPISTTGINQMPPQAELDREPGAVVDESKVSRTINVKPGELEAAFAQAKQMLDQGQGVKLALAAGNYRIDKALELTDLSDAAKEAVLVIEGSAPGEVFITGSVVRGFEPGTWELVDAEKRIYRHDWNNDWGFLSEGYYQPSHVLSHRREMLFVNGKSMNQEIIEGTTFVDRKGKVYDSVGMLVEEKGDGQGGYTYTGFRGIDVLDPGEFAIAELGKGDKKYDNHPYPNSLLLRLPEGMTTLDGATVEVASTPQLFVAEYKSNLVLRNIVFQHAASWWNNYTQSVAVDIDGDKDFGTHDVLIENCSISWNNGKGIGFGQLRNGELRNVTIANNGNFGIGFHHVYNSVCRNVDVLDNNWRGRLSDSDIHSTGGMTWSGERLRFYNCKFNGNFGSGWRSDVWVIDVIAEDCQFNNNHTHGIFHEIGWGPIVHRRCESSGNRNGVQLTNNKDVTFEDCTMLNNSNLAIMFYSMPGRVSPSTILERGMEFLDYNKNIVVRNSTIATTGDKSWLLGQNFGQGSLDNYHVTIKDEYTGENNRFYNPDQRKVFESTASYNDRQWADLEWWVKHTGEDTSSTWAAPAK